MKFKQFKIQNFMSWEKETFDLSPNVNIICGVSDKGKSAILKGLKWLKDNDPSGNEFASDWIKKKKKNGDFELTGECIFTVVFEDGTEISRVKGPKSNEYRISTLTKPLEAVGTRVPDEVSNPLNMSEINFQEQDNPHFLVGDKPGEIGRKLNQIASLSDIDTSFRNADSEIRDTRATIKREEAELIRAELQVEDFNWVDSAEKELTELEQIESSLSIIRNDEQRLRNGKSKIIELQKEIDRYKPLTVNAKKEIEQLISLKQEISTIENKIAELESIENKIADLEDEIERANSIVKAKEDISLLLKQRNEIDSLRKEIDQFIEIENKIIDAKEELEKAEKEYKKVATEYKLMAPKECPLCGGDWK
ncbi:hypothetical protein A2619_02235 [candidate division WWE3 bacterium RIFOXYD1_FULL_39_9]|uniref:Rad50/SbcC-type AAA domain-containing protein n=1 Tax=candidate division WWE3 bacterium RIFOXYD1_FULL_39_9 TaxID=1802649 RepID=A0A1F4X3H2_UNCKA|nr:MAG: hypothetical protein A2619_02235 [candidate division WWE3 bacterium RIFOXYD1_FULL_39_9]